MTTGTSTDPSDPTAIGHPSTSRLSTTIPSGPTSHFNLTPAIFRDNDNFDPYEFINKIVTDEDDVNKSLESVSLLLWELSQVQNELNHSLEKNASHIVTSIPSLLSDISLAQKEVSSLSSKISNLSDKHTKQYKNGSEDQGTGDEFALLRKYSRISENMAATRTALKEAENWTTLSAEMEAVFISQDYMRAATRLSEARRSLGLLVNSKDYDARKSMLEGFEDQILQRLKTELGKALDAIEVDNVHNLHQVYVLLAKSDVFTDIYKNNRLEILKKAWADSKTNEATSDSSVTILSRLETCADTLLRFLDREIPVLIAAFDDPISGCESLLVEYFSLLNSHVEPVYRSVRETDKSSFMTVLTSYATFLHSLSKRLEAFFDLFQKRVEPDQVGKQRLTKQGTADGLVWGRVLFDYLLSVQPSILRWEEELNTVYLDSLFPQKGSSFGKHQSDTNSHANEEISQILDTVVRFLRTKMVDSISRTKVLNLLLPRDKVFSMYERLVSTLFHKVSTALNAILDTKAPKSGGTKSRSSSVGAVLGGSRVSVGQEEDVETHGHHWTLFRQSLKVLMNAISSIGCVDEFLTELQKSLDQTVVLYTELEQGRALDSSEWSVTGFTVYLKDWFSPMKTKGVLGLDVNEDANKNLTISLSRTLKPQLRLIPLIVQRHVTSTLLTRIDALFLQYPGPESQFWISGPKTNLQAKSPFALDLPQFSLSALPYMTAIGEELLALPQHLEPYATSEEEGLLFGVEALPFIRDDDLEPYLDSDAAAESTPGNSEKKYTFDDVIVTHLWITSLSRATQRRFLDLFKSVVAISSKLSASGIKQMAADMSYLSNVLGAMEVDCEEEWNFVQEVIESDESGFKDFVEKYESPSDEDEYKHFWVKSLHEKRQ